MRVSVEGVTGLGVGDGLVVLPPRKRGVCDRTEGGEAKIDYLSIFANAVRAT